MKGIKRVYHSINKFNFIFAKYHWFSLLSRLEEGGVVVQVGFGRQNESWKLLTYITIKCIDILSTN